MLELKKIKKRMSLKYLRFFILILGLFFGFGCDDKKSEPIENSTLFSYQWYLYNSGQSVGSANFPAIGEDINVTSVWLQYKGRGVKVAVVDTGIEYEHPDLMGNIDSLLSYRYSDNSYNSSPADWQKSNPELGYHGTACAGIIGAISNDGYGVVGVAPEATLVGLNAFSYDTASNFADALYNQNREIDISSNSWNDTQGALDDESSEIIAIKNGATFGRSGKGVVYFFAAGNQRGMDQNRSYNSNWNRELNNPFVITVASLNANGKYSSYSNFGANILISAYGGEFGITDPAIVTTDLLGNYGLDSLEPSAKQSHFAVDGNENAEFTNTMNGTSAATPMMAGVGALILNANPNLSYRDIRYILATTARKNDPSDIDWAKNGAGYWINHNYGFGAVDAYSAVNKAKDFESLGRLIEKEYYSGEINSFVSFSSGFEVEIDVADNILLEHVELVLDLPHESSKDLEIVLYSPSGTASLLSHTHNISSELNLYRNFFTQFPLSSARYLDEESAGKWKIVIKDSVDNLKNGTIYGYWLKLRGRAL
ncbi:MAG: hypothetical protein QG567_1563 [Campylobacterota bacterium]|nr:hypothetical protein [Campylobacterota bacterium]